LSVIEERHLIVPIFIPHLGCPFQCIYCRQDKITNQSSASISRAFIKQTLDTAVKSRRFASSRTKEVAFYGGTFTNLPEEKMIQMLGAVSEYLKEGVFKSIRISTRPDCIDEHRLELIKSYGVSTVELGVQSMDDDVLIVSKRGHSSYDVIQAVNLLKQYDFEVGIQLMPGLPGDSELTFNRTIDRVLELRPHMARLYPAIVIKGTELANVYQAGEYRPLSVDEAIGLCSQGCMRLEEHGIPVIRIGLMSSPALLREGEILAGPWHDAFGFMVRSFIHQKKIEPFLSGFRDAAGLGIRAPLREVPLVRGYKNEGVRLIEKRSGKKIVYIKPDNGVPPGTIEVDEIKNSYVRC
jgi:histone acetyltransferase (RNA polymerase elongator complex component)